MESPPHPPPTLRQTSRTKSSTSLSSRARPKRNKSSSSLVSHSHHSHSHTNVSFAHHGKSTKKRTGSHSGPRKGPFDLAFTSMSSQAQAGADDGSDAEESDHEPQLRPPSIRRTSSSASNGKGKVPAKEKMERSLSAESDQTLTAVGTPPPPTAAAHARGRLAAAAPELKTVLGSLTSQTEGSEWESATDSPAPKTRDLSPERAGRTSNRAQAQRSPSRAQVAAPAVAERSRSKNRAKFEIGSIGASASASASNDRLVQPPLPSGALHQSAENSGAYPFPATAAQPTQLDPSQPSHTTIGFPSPAKETRQDSPPAQVKPVTPPTPPSQPTPTVAFPASQSSPDRPQEVDYQRRNGRKPSNASVMSNSSIRSNALSFASRRGPQLSGMRRSASGALGPQLDMHTAAGEYSSGSNLADLPHPNGSHPPPVARNHVRGESVGSLRSLRSVAETGYPRRAPSQGQRVASGSNLAPSGSSTALSMLGQISHANGGGNSPLGPPKRSASGYFSAALRGLANLPGLTPPLSSSPQPVSHLPRVSSTSAIVKGKGRATGSSTTPQFVAPVISKFLDEEDEPTLPLPRAPQGATPGGPLSRTQQKAYLARDAPTSASSLSLADMAGGGPAGAYYSSLAGNTAPVQSAYGHQQSQQTGMREWAAALLRDAEWIERQHRQAQRWRDPIGESLERVMNKRKAEAGKVRVAPLA